MGLQKYPLGGFLGGMNLVDNPYSLANNEAQIAKNVDLGIRDVLSSRKGYTEGGLAAELKSQTKTAGLGTSIKNGGEVFSAPENIKVEDGAVATAVIALNNFFSGWAIGSKFAFVLPAGAIPVGLVGRVKRRGVAGELGTERPQDSRLAFSLSIAGEPTGSDLIPGAGAQVPVALESLSRGSNESLAGLTGLTKAQVESEGFSLWYHALGRGGNNSKIEVDVIEATVYYMVPGTGSDVIQHMRPWYTGSNRYLMISAGGKIKRLKEGTITTLFTGTAGTTWYFEPIEYQAGSEEILLCMNGVDAPKYINQAGEVKEWKGATKIVPKGTMCRVWKGRVMIAGVAAHPQRLYESEPFNPFTPDDETNGGYGTNYVDIGTGEDDVDPITWLEVIDDVLLVFKKKSTWAIYSDNGLANYRIANVGAEGRFLSCVLDDRAYFANRYGVYSVTAEGNPRYESYNLEPLFKGESTSVFEAVDLEKLASAGRMGVLPTGRVFLACTGTGAASANSYLFEAYPRLRGASSSRKGNDERTPWVINQFTARSVTAVCSYRKKDNEPDKLVAGLTTTAGAAPELVTMFTSARDGLEPISWLWKSGEKAEISEEPFERIRRANLLMKGKIKARVISDEQVSATATLESTGESMQRFRPETWGRYHCLELWEEGQMASSVYAAELAFRGGKEHT